MLEQPSVAAGARTGGEQHRLFFALLPDEATRASISRAAAWLQASYRPTGRWIAPEEFHVTLRFIAEESRLNEALVERAMLAGKAVRIPTPDWTSFRTLPSCAMPTSRCRRVRSIRLHGPCATSP